jgi:hypothetical protein
MTQSFADMIYLFSCGALGLKPVLNHEIDFMAVHHHSMSQGVWHTVFLSIKRLYDNAQLSIDNDIFNNLRNQFMLSIMRNTQRTYLIHNLIKKLEDNKVRCCVLKGEIMSALYKNPDCRISSDTDILIEPRNKKRAIDILNEFGFDVKPLGATSNHIVAAHPVAGIVELHLNLYNELYEDVWFNNIALIQEECRVVKVDDDKEILTLGITDGLIFTALHCIKHFLSSGVGIRQIMDILLYMKTFYNQINWERFNKTMKHLKYENFIYNCIGIGIKYLNFDKEHLPSHTCNNTIMTAILDDIELGGVFGKNENERDGFSMQYTKARFNSFKKDEYHSYIKMWWHRKLITIIFPHPKTLALKFPYLRKSPLLYPIAWLHRIIRLIINLIKKDTSLNRYSNPAKQLIQSDIIDRRMELIRRLDMV